NREPQIAGLDTGALEAGRRHADHGDRPVVDPHRLADPAVLAAERSPPVVMVEHDDALVALGEPTAASRLYAERREEVQRDHLAEGGGSGRRLGPGQSHDAREEPLGEYRAE